ncbi:MAG: helix-turn-helix transcriptional regulator [Bdellovibrionaceae bacterium]|nr:helix-turn-helix transcriptional regulator [Pseudobdellovibrionaceae bacterium]
MEKSKNANVLSSRCPSREILSHVTGTWANLILIALLEKTHRFSELRKRVDGISEKMLSQTLRLLEGDGFVLKKDYKEIPPKVEYSLTPLGKGVAEHIHGLTNWIEKNLPAVLARRGKM